MNGGNPVSGVQVSRLLGASTRRNPLDETHNFEGLGPSESERVPRARAATTARAGAGSPRRFVTETSPYRGGP